MQSIPEIVESEKQRTNLFECRIAKLYRVGSFMRAYNWSAWLFVKYRDDLKVSNRRVKAVEEPVTMIGFPPASIEKYAPEGAQVTTNSDGSVDVVFPSSIISDDADIKELTTKYNEWRSELPVTESPSPKKEKSNDTISEKTLAVTSAPNTLTSIMQRILAYPLESKSPVENMIFISELKQQLSALI